MSEFPEHEFGYLVDDTSVFSTSFHVIKESSSFSKNPALMLGGRLAARKSDSHFGKFTGRIENFTRLKDLLKKRKITGLCVKSRRFQIGNRDCRLIVYPRAVDNINAESLFDQESGFLVQDTVVFSAEVLILKKTSIMQEFCDAESFSSGNLATNSGPQIEAISKRGVFTWRVENFLSFKEIMETRKIFSKFFQAGGCELRIGVYESFDAICIYFESDQSAGSDPDKNYWVQYRIAVVNQKNPAKTVWKESSICTKTWNNSVLQFMKVSDMLECDVGFLVRDTVVFVCEIIDFCPWFEFSDLEGLKPWLKVKILATTVFLMANIICYGQSGA
ncbi:hypothetical protein KSP40_PGU003862 [Platanthera guangdongensis]|uniref:MATH domain-containing protein n=1 Tax=Platanthera guangdongensis TaxID=2320717 RepID=A0ABR2MUA5_9ASPA